MSCPATNRLRPRVLDVAPTEPLSLSAGRRAGRRPAHQNGDGGWEGLLLRSHFFSQALEDREVDSGPVLHFEEQQVRSEAYLPRHLQVEVAALWEALQDGGDGLDACWDDGVTGLAQEVGDRGLGDCPLEGPGEVHAGSGWAVWIGSSVRE